MMKINPSVDDIDLSIFKVFVWISPLFQVPDMSTAIKNQQETSSSNQVLIKIQSLPSPSWISKSRSKWVYVINWKSRKREKSHVLSVANFDSLKLTLDSFKDKARAIFLETKLRKIPPFSKQKLISIICEHEYFMYRLLSQSFKRLVSSLRFRKFLTVNPSRVWI